MLNYENIARQKFGESFINETKNIASFLGIPYLWILGVMWSESGMNPKAVNINTNNTRDAGIIQFNDVTAQHLGTTTAQILNMSALQQLGIVKKYYTPIRGKIKKFGDLYAYNHSLYYFYNPGLYEVKQFKKRVTDRFKADTGINPDNLKVGQGQTTEVNQNNIMPLLLLLFLIE